MSWVLAHPAELFVFCVGIALRISMHFSFGPMSGYDAHGHWEVARIIAAEGKIPTPADTYCGYHPPLYYALVAALLKLGASQSGAQWMSIVIGVLKLGVVWLGLEWYVKSRSGRIAGLALAAVLPVAVHMDGMITNEVASGLFAAAALVLVPKAFAAQGRRRWVLATVIGVILSLQLMSKISALMCIAAIGIAVVLEALFDRESRWKARIIRAMPWAMLVAAPMVLTGWYFARNVQAYGKPFLSSFDVRPEQLAEMVKLDNQPYLDRRPIGFLFGWDPRIFSHPYWDVALGDHARYAEAITAMTFVDYWNYHFSGLGPGVVGTSSINGHAMSEDIMAISRPSMVGGAVIALACCVSWVACLWLAMRRRMIGTLALLALPALTLLSGLHFAMKYPFDGQGVIKSSYLQFGMMPLFGLFGLAVAWSLDRRRRWPIFVLLTASVWFVAAYTLYCRLRIPLLPV